MSDLLSEGLLWLEQEAFAYAARLVTYSRGELTCSAPALVGKLDTQTVETEDATIAYTGRRFWFRPQDLDWGEGPIEPQRGDLIALPLPDGKRAIYTVTGFPPAQPSTTGLLEVATAYQSTQ